MTIQSALKMFTSSNGFDKGVNGSVSGMSRILIHDACDFDLGKARESQIRKPILAIPVGADGIDAQDVELLATAAQDICNFGASRRMGAIDESYQGQPIDAAVATLTQRGLCVSPHDRSGKDGTFLHMSYDGIIVGEDLHLQMVFDT